LLLDGQVSNRHDIVRDDSLERTSSVLDLELGSVRLVGRRCLGIVLGLLWREETDEHVQQNRVMEWRITHVKETSDRRAASRRDPKVRRSSIEDDLEGLGRSTERNLGELRKVILVNVPVRIAAFESEWLPLTY
jgi:hypothetical protein